jgi:hypothetical protein
MKQAAQQADLAHRQLTKLCPEKSMSRHSM